MINRINQNTFDNNNLFKTLENKKVDSYFLEKKRYIHPLSSFNRLSEEKENNFCFPNSFDLKKHDMEKNNISQSKEEINIYKKSNIINSLQEDNELNINDIYKNCSKIKKKFFLKSLNNSENQIKSNNSNEDIPHKNNSNIIDIRENELDPNLNGKEISYIHINEKVNDNNLNSSCNNTQNFFKTDKKIDENSKKNIFNVTYIDGEDNENLYKHYNPNNNEVKVLKNNKVVYVNSSLLNSYHTYKNLKFVNKESMPGKSKRGSKYRGVSRNGNQWQVLIMKDKSKSYVKTYSSEYIAARVYDILSIKNKGLKARTNFIYDSEQINKIREMDIDIRAKNISETIIKMFK